MIDPRVIPSPFLGNRPFSLSRFYYGPGFRAHSLANFTLGSTSAQGHFSTTGKNGFSVRFRAPRSGKISQIAIRIETVYTANTPANSYGWGTGGTIVCELRADDGTALHLPSSTVLGSFQTSGSQFTFFSYGAVFVATVSGGVDDLTWVTLTPQPTLTAGVLYHLVYRQTGADSAANWVSVNGLYVPITDVNAVTGVAYTSLPATPKQPIASDLDYEGLLYVDNGAWTTTAAFFGTYLISPCWGIRYTDGTNYGQFCYINQQLVSADDPKVQGATLYGEIFTPTVTVPFGRAVVYARRSLGADPLTVIIRRVADSVIVAQATIPSSQFTTLNLYYYGTALFVNPAPLVAGTQYRIELSVPNTSAYNIPAMNDGGVGGGQHADPQEFFSDGHMQQKTGAVWTDFVTTDTTTDGHLAWFLQP